MESRGISTDENTPTALMREGYYPIVNGYKAPFLDKDAMQSVGHDVFAAGTKFDWIYALFMFDRDLRAVTFKHILRAEAVMRTAVVYAFCEAHPEPNAYLVPSSYCREADILTPKGYRGDKRKLHRRNLSKLIDTLSGKVFSGNQKPPVEHHLRAYGHVPLWVLAKDMTFGNLHHFYQLLERPVQKRACRLILSATKAPSDLRMEPHDLLRHFSVLVDFRNLCAHDERLYCAKVGRSRDIGYSDMALSLLNIVQEPGFVEFTEDLFGCFRHYGSDLKVVSMDSLLADMGFSIPPD